MTSTVIVSRTTVKVYSSLADAQALADAGKGNQLHWFRFDSTSPKRKYFVDNDGWLLVGNGSSTTNGTYSQSATEPINPGETQAIITAQEAAAIPDLGRVQISSRDRTSVHIESSNNTVLNRFLNYNPLTYLLGEESFWTNTGTSTSQPVIIYADNSTLASQPLSDYIYITGAGNNNTMEWHPGIDREGFPDAYNPQLWVHAPVPLPPTPLRSFRFTPLGGVDFSSQPGGTFNSDSLTGETVSLGRIFSNLPTTHTYTVTVNIKENKPFRLVYGGQRRPRENKGIIFYCQDGKTRVTAGTNTTSNGIPNWDTSVLNGWYETNFEMGDCGTDLDLTVTVSDGVATASYGGNNINIPITQTTYNTNLYFTYDTNSGTDGLVKIVVRGSDEETTSELNVTELEKNNTTSGIELPISVGNELAEVYSTGTVIEDQDNAIAGVTIAEQSDYVLYYSQKLAGIQSAQFSSMSVAEIEASTVRTANQNIWSYNLLGRPLYSSRIVAINIPFPSTHTGVELHIVLGNSYFNTARAYATSVDLGYINVPAGQSVSLTEADLRSRNGGSDIVLTQDFTYLLFICNSLSVDIYDSTGSYAEFNPETRIYENPPWINNYADIDGGTSLGIGAEVIIEY